jgi:hypothetical protein
VHVADRVCDGFPPRALLGHRQDDQVRDQDPVGVQVAGDQLRILVAARHEEPSVGRDRRDRGAAAVEEDELRLELERLQHPLGDVARPRGARQSAARAPAPDRRHAG